MTRLPLPGMDILPCSLGWRDLFKGTHCVRVVSADASGQPSPPRKHFLFDPLKRTLRRAPSHAEKKHAFWGLDSGAPIFGEAADRLVLLDKRLPEGQPDRCGSDATVQHVVSSPIFFRLDWTGDREASPEDEEAVATRRREETTGAAAGDAGGTGGEEALASEKTKRRLTAPRIGLAMRRARNFTSRLLDPLRRVRDFGRGASFRRKDAKEALLGPASSSGGKERLANVSSKEAPGSGKGGEGPRPFQLPPSQGGRRVLLLKEDFGLGPRERPEKGDEAKIEEESSADASAQVLEVLRADSVWVFRGTSQPKVRTLCSALLENRRAKQTRLLLGETRL